MIGERTKFFSEPIHCIVCIVRSVSFNGQYIGVVPPQRVDVEAGPIAALAGPPNDTAAPPTSAVRNPCERKATAQQVSHGLALPRLPRCNAYAPGRRLLPPRSSPSGREPSSARIREAWCKRHGASGAGRNPRVSSRRSLRQARRSAAPPCRSYRRSRSAGRRNRQRRVKLAGERAAKDDGRSLNSLLEKLMIDHLKANGYLPGGKAAGKRK